MKISYPVAILLAVVLATFVGKQFGKELAPTMSAKLQVRYVADSQ